MMPDAWACVSGIIPANAWRSALPLSCCLAKPGQCRAEQSWVPPFLLSLCSPWQFIKGNTSFFLAPGRLISTAAEAVTADKRQQAPELRCTQHLYLLRHSPCLWQGRRRRGGENGGQAAAFMCLYIDMSHQGERWTDILQWSHQSAPFNTPVQHTVILAHKDWQRTALLLLLTYFYKPLFQLAMSDRVNYQGDCRVWATNVKKAVLLFLLRQNGLV